MLAPKWQVSLPYVAMCSKVAAFFFVHMLCLLFVHFSYLWYSRGPEAALLFYRQSSREVN